MTDTPTPSKNQPTSEHPPLDQSEALDPDNLEVSSAPQTLDTESEQPAPVRQRFSDEDDDTWTNQPQSRDADESEGSEEGDDSDEDEVPVVTRKSIQNARDVLIEEIPMRAQRAKLKLHPHLTGAYLIEVSNTGDKFLFDWRTEEPKVTEVTEAPALAAADSTDPKMVDSIITISDQNMMAVRSGDLNPQVAMLADKIKVQGKVSPAVYLFNLVAPRARE